MFLRNGIPIGAYVNAAFHIPVCVTAKLISESEE